MRLPRDCFADLVADLSHDIRASDARIFMCREQVAKVLNMFKNLMRFLFAKICRKIVARLSCDIRASIANRSPRNLTKLQC